MHWKKFKIIISIACLSFFVLIVLIGLFWYLQKPQKLEYVIPPKPILNWQVTQPKDEMEKTPFKSNKKTNISSQKKHAKTKMNISLCEDNPNAPDYLSRQMDRVHNDNNACAKLKLNMDLNFHSIIRFFLDNLK